MPGTRGTRAISSLAIPASKAKKAKVAMLKKFVTKIGNDNENKKDTKSSPKNYNVRKTLNKNNINGQKEAVIKIKKKTKNFPKSSSTKNIDEKKNKSIFVPDISTKTMSHTKIKLWM